VLVGFVPELPLDPALQQLLNVQVERLVARIQGNSVHAEGIGVVVDRTYRVGDVYGDHFKTTIVDPYGVGLDSACDFSGNLLIVNGLDNPWRGRATFRRRL
jgi:cyanate lyase